MKEIHDYINDHVTQGTKGATCGTAYNVNSVWLCMALINIWECGSSPRVSAGRSYIANSQHIHPLSFYDDGTIGRINSTKILRSFDESLRSRDVTKNLLRKTMIRSHAGEMCRDYTT